MRIEECALPKMNSLVSDYVAGEKKARAYFDYDFTDHHAYLNRRLELRDQQFPREALADHLYEFNKQFTTHPNVFNNIEKLRLNDCTVVITGQQAGFLTGPLYTIYKAISTIQHAKSLEKELNTPVIPVFWVAGEDHDYQEINHIWLLENNRLIKKKYTEIYNDKRPVSAIQFDKHAMNQWIEAVFRSFGESENTKTILQLLHEKLESSTTVTEFFIHIMASFFDESGLIFIDSAHDSLRKIESPFFKAMIERNNEIREAFQIQSKALEDDGYPIGVQAEDQCAHVFYHHQGERQLLYVNEQQFVDKDSIVSLSQTDLKRICDESPERLSNNVVTRPLMQELLFPTLAFVAGPGEMTYWAQLKGVFSIFGRHMPPVIPRMHATIVDKKVNKMLKTFGLSLQSVFANGVKPYRGEWFEKQKGKDVDLLFTEAKHAIDLVHSKIRKYAWETSHNLGQISEKNRLLIMRQLDYMKNRVEKEHEDRHSQELAQFDQLEAIIVPHDGLQERVWNIFYFINEYGFDFIRSLMIDHPFQEPKHYIFHL